MYIYICIYNIWGGSIVMQISPKSSILDWDFPLKTIHFEGPQELAGLVRGNPKIKWMMKWGTPILGNAHMNQMDLQPPLYVLGFGPSPRFGQHGLTVEALDNIVPFCWQSTSIVLLVKSLNRIKSYHVWKALKVAGDPISHFRCPLCRKGLSMGQAPSGEQLLAHSQVSLQVAGIWSPDDGEPRGG